MFNVKRAEEILIASQEIRAKYDTRKFTEKTLKDLEYLLEDYIKLKKKEEKYERK